MSSFFDALAMRLIKRFQMLRDVLATCCCCRTNPGRSREVYVDVQVT